jgi:hypothetical protein
MEELQRDISRRTIIKRAGVGAAVVWAAPSLTSIGSRALAQYEHPECQGATCETFIACSSSNPDCVCVTTDRGGFCVPGSTACAGLPLCPGGTSAECPAGSVCAVNTCCGDPVCVAESLTSQCPSGGAGAAATRPSSGPGTLGG